MKAAIRLLRYELRWLYQAWHNAEDERKNATSTDWDLLTVQMQRLQLEIEEVGGGLEILNAVESRTRQVRKLSPAG